MRIIKQILWLVQFLTTIPLGLTISMEPEDLGRSLAYAPLIGLLLGGILAGSLYLLRLLFPAMISSLFLCMIYVFLTGGLHLDGLGDTADGLFSHRPKERILEIMKDSRVGTNAVLAIILIVLGYVFLFMEIPTKALGLIVLMPVIGRMALPLGAGLEKYARQNGLGLHFINFCGLKEILIGIAITSILFILILGIKGLLIVFLVGILISLIIKFFAAKIDGITGDILGAVCELAQLLYLIVGYLIYLRPQTLL
ncbi:MAG TPA: adenosylcobinamide-GDP ribazoletransferase [Firmicutes bacterium]|nr:adenosylcobinamide-GDP ribazoletransferase [Bacillota bacterium]